MKYIVFSGGAVQVRIFGDNELHADVAEEVSETVESAGFIKFDDAGLPYAYGDSVSLGVAARPELDTSLLRAIWGV